MLRMNLLIRAANKHSDVFLRIIHNICKITLTLFHLFIFPIKCIKFRAVQHSTIRFQKQTTTVLVIAENDLI